MGAGGGRGRSPVILSAPSTHPPAAAGPLPAARGPEPPASAAQGRAGQLPLLPGFPCGQVGWGQRAVVGFLHEGWPGPQRWRSSRVLASFAQMTVPRGLQPPAPPPSPLWLSHVVGSTSGTEDMCSLKEPLQHLTGLFVTGCSWAPPSWLGRQKETPVGVSGSPVGACRDSGVLLSSGGPPTSSHCPELGLRLAPEIPWLLALGPAPRPNAGSPPTSSPPFPGRPSAWSPSPALLWDHQDSAVGAARLPNGFSFTNLTSFNGPILGLHL